MNLIIFCLTILAWYGIVLMACKAWNRADIISKMDEIEETEKQDKDIKEFKKAHKGDLKKQRKNIKRFTKE